MGSLSGALASKKVTEAFKGQLSTDGNRACRVKAKAGLTARRMCRAGAKAELSEPMLVIRIGRDYQTKVTPGITGWYDPRVHINGRVRHLDVGSS